MSNSTELYFWQSFPSPSQSIFTLCKTSSNEARKMCRTNNLCCYMYSLVWNLLVLHCSKHHSWNKTKDYSLPTALGRLLFIILVLTVCRNMFFPLFFSWFRSRNILISMPSLQGTFTFSGKTNASSSCMEEMCPSRYSFSFFFFKETNVVWKL